MEAHSFETAQHIEKRISAIKALKQGTKFGGILMQLMEKLVVSAIRTVKTHDWAAAQTTFYKYSWRVAIRGDDSR